jgi:hypothetical protein
MVLARLARRIDTFVQLMLWLIVSGSAPLEERLRLTGTHSPSTPKTEPTYCVWSLHKSSGRLYHQYTAKQTLDEAEAFARKFNTNSVIRSNFTFVVRKDEGVQS